LRSSDVPIAEITPSSTANIDGRRRRLDRSNARPVTTSESLGAVFA